MRQRRTTGRKAKQIVVISVALVITIFYTAAPTRAALGQSTDPMDILVVANKAVPVESVSLNQLRDFFLRIRKEWLTGMKALAINSALMLALNGGR